MNNRIDNPDYGAGDGLGFKSDWATVQESTFAGAGGRCQACGAKSGDTHASTGTPVRIGTYPSNSGHIALCQVCGGQYSNR